MSAAAEFSGPSRRGTKVTRDAEGNRVEEATEDNIGIRTHDYEDEDEVNRRLFGEGAVAAPRQKVTRTTTASGDIVEEAAEGNMRIRTHDHSDEAEVNKRLFGEGAVSSSTKSGPKTITRKDREGNTVVEAADDDTGIRTHDFSNQDEVNARLFGKGARNAD